ncbi:ribosome maturation factor RimM [Marivivens donghaensis]|uniref:Ribosome maturation factor RimM n=1 Tax=Marivivens donghaensis TaxID=1699413 RepID=A0ABX0VW96_9RHOB|nr:MULTISPECIES: ribosome maturation factor RimM [Marivivens]NIY70947.1 ribosome maturation factor RimM [Marivivens donghaensis]
MTQDRVVVGAIGGAFGVRGEVRLKSYCAEPDAIADYTPLYTADGRTFPTIVVTGVAQNALIVRMDGVVSKEDADKLKGTQVFADRDKMPPPADDEYYYADLIGLQVFDTGGNDLGTVKTVMNHGATDLLEIHKAGYKSTVLLPFTQAAVPTVDIAAGRIVADPPEGLFPDE